MTSRMSTSTSFKIWTQGQGLWWDTSKWYCFSKLTENNFKYAKRKSYSG